MILGSAIFVYLCFPAHSRHPEFGLNWETPEGLDFETLLKDWHRLRELYIFTYMTAPHSQKETVYVS